jgi:hypothetical protein
VRLAALLKDRRDRTVTRDNPAVGVDKGNAEESRNALTGSGLTRAGSSDEHDYRAIRVTHCVTPAQS